MPDFTPNLELIKPLGNENFSVSHANGNADKIDYAFETLKNTTDENELKIIDKTKSILENLPLNVFDTTGGVMGELVQRGVNPVWFGAKPDEARLYTSEFNASIIFLMSIGGGELKVPAGRWRTELMVGYDLRTASWIGGNGITIVGSGKDTVFTLLPEDSSIGGELVSVRGKSSSEKLKNVALRNFSVENYENSPTVGNGIGVVRTENILIENVYTERCTNYGITVETENENVTLNNITSRSNAKSGIALTSSTTRRVTLNNATLTNNTEYGLYCSYNSGTGMEGLIINNPTLRFNGKSGMFGSHFDQSCINGGNISDNEEEGIYLHNSNVPKILGAVIQRNKLEGIRLSQCTGAILDDIDVKDNAQNATIKAGIRLHNNTVDTTIVNSDIGNKDTTYQVNGVRIDANGTVLQGNRFNSTGAGVVIGTGYVAKMDGFYLDANISGSVPVNMNRRIFYGVGIPTSGTFKRGDMVINLQPGPSGAILYNCIADGNPGTWNLFGRAAAQADSVATDIAGLNVQFNALLAKLRAAGLLNS